MAKCTRNWFTLGFILPRDQWAITSKYDLKCYLLQQDYEYASYNPVAFDIANHFCEMAANYHTEEPHILDYNKYPGTWPCGLLNLFSIILSYCEK